MLCASPGGLSRREMRNVLYFIIISEQEQIPLKVIFDSSLPDITIVERQCLIFSLLLKNTEARAFPPYSDFSDILRDK